MKKIIVEKNESVADLVDRILNEPDNKVTLVVPKGSALGKTMRNFHILKREIEDAGRIIKIESVDENILAFAKESGMENNHPLWNEHSLEGGFSDILVETDTEDEESSSSRKTSSKKQQKAETPVKIAIQTEEEDKEEDFKNFRKEYRGESSGEHEPENEGAFSDNNRFFKEATIPDEHDEEQALRKRTILGKIVTFGIPVVLVIAGLFFAVPHFLGSAKITIDFKKTPWEYNHAFTASVSAVSPATQVGNQVIIKGSVIKSSKNTTQLFQASGSANVSEKAKGTLTIYNAYSSAAQSLVATTRFVTPDGKTFRIISGVVVPGAQITNGQIVPSSINVQVIADQAGDSYNVGPIAKLTVPGFQGTAKYDGFYGSLASSTSGGFIGFKKVPTASDIAAAKASTTIILQSAFSDAGRINYPENFKILNGATSTQITKLSVNTTTDQNGKFSVFGEAAFQAIGFDESILKTFLLTLAQGNNTTSAAFSSLDLKYGDIRADFINNTMSFSLDARGAVEPAFSADEFRDSILGKSMSDARLAIAALPALADGTISAWPAWLGNIPSNKDKIQIVAN